MVFTKDEINQNSHIFFSKCFSSHNLMGNHFKWEIH